MEHFLHIISSCLNYSSSNFYEKICRSLYVFTGWANYEILGDFWYSQNLYVFKNIIHFIISRRDYRALFISVLLPWGGGKYRGWVRVNVTSESIQENK